MHKVISCYSMSEEHQWLTYAPLPKTFNTTLVHSATCNDHQLFEAIILNYIARGRAVKVVKVTLDLD